MFINKDGKSNSLSHSHKSERIQIHSHVQKGRRYKKSDGGVSYATQLPLLQPGRRLSDTSEDQPGNNQVGSKRNLEKDTISFVHYQPDSPLIVRSRQPSDSPDPNIDPLLWDYSQSYLESAVSPQSIPIFPAFAEDSFDPFDVTCVKIDSAIHSLLQYFLKVFHPNIWHLERAVRPDHSYTFRTDAMTLASSPFLRKIVPFLT